MWTNRPVWPQGISRPQGQPTVPSTLDWDMWLGPAPWRPYHPAYLPFVWRGWWDFGTGALGDIAAHTFAGIFRVLKLNHPESVQAQGSLQVHTNWKIVENKETYPRASIVYYKFAARGDLPPIKLVFYDGGLRPEIPDELEEERTFQTNGTLYIGEKGKILNGRIIPESKMKEYELPPKTLPRSIGHREEWVAACKSGGPTGSNFDVSGPIIEAVLLGNIALRMAGRKLKWDAANMRITNVPEANEYLHRQYRKGWTL